MAAIAEEVDQTKVAPRRPPPAWDDLVSTPEFKALPDEDKSHAVEAWRDYSTHYGKTYVPQWQPEHESELATFTETFQGELEKSIRFTGEDKPYRQLAHKIIFDPARPGDGLIQAARDGVIEKPPREQVRSALTLQQAIAENRELQAVAGGNQEAKALAVGAGRGAAFLGGAIGTAAGLTPLNTALTGVGGPLLGGAAVLVEGIVGGTVASMGYDEVVAKLAENNKTIESAATSAKLNPNWTLAGEIASFGVPAPIGIAKGIHRFQLVAENIGKEAALKQAAQYVAVSGGIGAASAPVMAAVERFKNAALDLGHDEQADLFDPKSIVANTVLAIMLGNLGVKFTKFSQGEAASIHARGMRGDKLSAAEAEVFETISRKIAADPKSFVFEAEQATMGSQPLGGATAARTRPIPAKPAAPSPAAAPSGAGPSGSPPPPTGSTPPPRTNGTKAGAFRPRKAGAFATQDEFSAFMDAARKRGDVEAASAAWAMNNAAGNKNFFAKWYNGGKGESEVQWFANSVLHSRKNAQHAEFVRQQQTASTAPRGTTEQSQSQRADQGTPSTHARDNRGDTGRPGGIASVPRADPGPLAREVQVRPPAAQSEAQLRTLVDNDLAKILAQPVQQTARETLNAFAPPTLGGLGFAGSFATPALSGTETQKDVVSSESIVAPEGSSLAGPQTNKTHVISTAVNRGGKFYVGSKWNQPHSVIGEVEHNLGNPAQNERGFIVRDATGKLRFVDREEAAKVAKAAGQANVTKLQSEDLKRTFTTRPPHDAFGSETTPVAAAIINDVGGIVSKTQAKRSGRYERNAELYDDAPSLKHPTHNKLFSASGEMPDAAAQTLFDAGLIPDPSVGAMWKAIAAESQTARTIAKEGRTQLATAKQDAAFEKTLAAKDAPAVQAQDLNVGDKVKVGAEEMRVVAIDERTHDVTLEDGKRFGVQEVRDNETIYGEHMPAPRAEADFTPERAPLPKLRRGEDQGDLLSGQREDLTLVGETKLERAAREAEQSRVAEAARQAEVQAARAEFEKAQGNLFGEGDFERFFRDSKVVDENGNPLVVNHTTGEKFDKFDDAKQSRHGVLGKGFYFANKEWSQGEWSQGINIRQMKSYLRIENPLRPTIAEVRELHERPKGFPTQEELIAQGYDGIIQDRGFDGTWYVVFKANQVMSADKRAIPPDDMRRADAGESGGIPASLFDDAVKLGREIFRKGMQFAEWAGEMLARLGNKIATALHEIWKSITGQGVREEFRESGGLFGSGRRKEPDAIGGVSRVLSGRVAYEGSSDVLLKKPRFKFLGLALNRSVDLIDKRLGDVLGKIEAFEARTPRGDRAKARETLSAFIDARESGRPADAAAIRAAASPAEQDLISTVEKIAEYTGRVSTTIVQPNGTVGVHVLESTPTGPRGGMETHKRPLRNLGKEFWPRILRPEYEAVLRDPLSDAAMWRQMVDDLVTNGNIATPAEADAYIRSTGDQESANNFLGSLYRARGDRLPASWYDTSIEGFERWAARWATVVSQIESYGQKLLEHDTDLFDKALKLTTHAPTQAFLNSVRARVFNERSTGPAAKYLLDAPRLLATGLMLTNPLTETINLVSAKVANVYTFGLKANIGRNPLAVFSKGNHLDAHQLGILTRDAVRLLYRDDVPGLDVLKNFTNRAMKVSGYTAVENLTRVDSYLTALAFLHDGLAAVRRDPESNSAFQFMGWIKRNDLDLRELMSGSPEARDSFLRWAVKRAQGGYSVAETPHWLSSPLGRFFFQFSKWATMHTRNVITNAIRPTFTGTRVTIKVGGKTVSKRVFDVRPLLYFLSGSILGGEAIAFLKEKAFGIERRDATFAEIGAAVDEDVRDGLVLLAVRALNDMITLGSLGILGTPVQLAKDVRDRSKFRNPLSPPGVSLVKTGGDLLLSAWEQGKLTMADLNDFMKSSVAAYRYTSAFVLEQSKNADLQWRAAELKARRDDLSFLRAATERYAKDAELPPSRMTSAGRTAKTPETPLRRDLHDALLIGDADTAKAIVAEHLAGLPSIAAMQRGLESLRDSVTATQPVRVGGISGLQRRLDFGEWAKAKLSPRDVERIRGLDATYRQTAVSVGLMHDTTRADELRSKLKAETQRRKLAVPATEPQKQTFIDTNLRRRGLRPRSQSLSLTP